MARLPPSAARAPGSGTSTATSTSTSTTGSASCASATPTPIAAAVRPRWTPAPTSRRHRGLDHVAEELRRRWGLPHWRFTNSGTESTMDAIHLAPRRAAARYRQDRGHLPRPSRRRDGLRQAAARRDGRPCAARLGAVRRGLPRELTDLTHVVRQRRRRPRGAAGRARRRRRDHGAGDDNVNIVPPVAGYLERVRELTAARGVTLIFDEVKTGARWPPAAPPSCTASRPTSCAWRRRSAAASRAARSA